MWSFFPIFFISLALFSKEFFICNEEFLVGFLFFCVFAFSVKNVQSEIDLQHGSATFLWLDRIDSSFSSLFNKKKTIFVCFEILKSIFSVVSFFLPFSQQKPFTTEIVGSFDINDFKNFFGLITEGVFFLAFVFEKRTLVFFSKTLFFLQ
jgi:hypothetical protein